MNVVLSIVTHTLQEEKQSIEMNKILSLGENVHGFSDFVHMVKE